MAQSHCLLLCTFSVLRVVGVLVTSTKPLDRCTSCNTTATQGLPSNPTDLRAKPSKEGDKWQRFHFIKCKLLGHPSMPQIGCALGSSKLRQ